MGITSIYLIEVQVEQSSMLIIPLNLSPMRSLPCSLQCRCSKRSGHGILHLIRKPFVQIGCNAVISKRRPTHGRSPSRYRNPIQIRIISRNHLQSEISLPLCLCKRLISAHHAGSRGVPIIVRRVRENPVEKDGDVHEGLVHDVMEVMGVVLGCSWKSDGTWVLVWTHANWKPVFADLEAL